MFGSQKGSTALPALFLTACLAALPMAGVAAPAHAETTVGWGDLDDIGKQSKFVKAAANGDLSKVQKLYSGSSAEDRSLALCLAARRGNETIIEFLLMRGVSARANPFALEVAVAYGYDKVVKLLLDYSADSSPPELVKYAAEFGYTEILGMLFQNGANPDNPDALMAAVEKGRIESVKMLLQRGKTNQDHRAALKWAIVKGQRGIVSEFFFAGANPCGSDLVTDAEYAEDQGHESMVGLVKSNRGHWNQKHPEQACSAAETLAPQG